MDLSICNMQASTPTDISKRLTPKIIQWATLEYSNTDKHWTKTPNSLLLCRCLSYKIVSLRLTQRSMFSFQFNIYLCSWIDIYSKTFNLIQAMGRAASSFAKLADTACQELPSTLAAIRLSGMEISDLTLELSDLRLSLSFSFPHHLYSLLS